MFKLNYMELIQSAKDLIIIWLIIIKVFVVEKKNIIFNFTALSYYVK